jgi:curved DNA-binding protein
MQCKDFYRILEIEADATQAQIKVAYRKLARRYHPDVSLLQDAEERFKEIAAAYDILKDPDRRVAYDRFGQRRTGRAPDWERQFEEFFSRDESFSRSDLDELFAQFDSDATT